MSVRRDGRDLLNGLDLSVEAPGFTVIMGPNGAGKSLLLRVLANLIQPDTGQLQWCDSAHKQATRGWRCSGIQKTGTPKANGACKS